MRRVPVSPVIGADKTQALQKNGDAVMRARQRRANRVDTVAGETTTGADLAEQRGRRL